MCAEAGGGGGFSSFLEQVRRFEYEECYYVLVPNTGGTSQKSPLSLQEGLVGHRKNPPSPSSQEGPARDWRDIAKIPPLPPAPPLLYSHSAFDPNPPSLGLGLQSAAQVLASKADGEEIPNKPRYCVVQLQPSSRSLHFENRFLGDLVAGWTLECCGNSLAGGPQQCFGARKSKHRDREGRFGGTTSRLSSLWRCYSRCWCPLRR